MCGRMFRVIFRIALTCASFVGAGQEEECRLRTGRGVAGKFCFVSKKRRHSK